MSFSLKTEAVRGMLAAAELTRTGSEVSLGPLTGGANNRVYAVEGTTRSVVVKQYFPDDTSRLQAEWAFLDYAWASGIRVVPEPIACDLGAGVAILGHLPGRRLAPGDPDDDHVRQAAGFATALQDQRERAQLPPGAEACFTVDEHLKLVDERVKRVRTIEDPEAAELVRDTLQPVWERVRSAVIDAAEDPQAVVDRCVSPSDFGFHNALVDADGTVRFHDFEYAGWDDPAKLALRLLLPARGAGRHRVLRDTAPPDRSKPLPGARGCCSTPTASSGAASC